MNGIKGVLQSKTVWANIITALGGTTLGAKYLAGVDPGALVEAVAQLATVAGPILSSIFRIQATKQIVLGAKTS